MSNTIEPIVMQCIDALNKQLAPEEKIDAATDTILVGDGGKLDSLGLITLMVSIEDALAERGMSARLVDGMMDENNGAHYATVGTLIAWINATAN